MEKVQAGEIEERNQVVFRCNSFPLSSRPKCENFRQLNWPGIEDIGLARAHHSWRLGGIGGSDANIILSGNSEHIRQLWLEKRGDREPEDLSNSLPVMLGNWTEAFNREWYERVSGQAVSRIGHSIQCSDHAWRRCTIDGFIDATQSVFEAKHTNGFSKADDLLERYMPQLQHNMAVAKVERATLSVIYGNHKFEIIEVAADWLYQLDLLEAESEFWDCVQTGQEPVPAPVPVPPRPVGTREVCFEGNNAWASAAVDWLEYRDAAKIHASAAVLIKGLLEDDVSRAFGHGLEAKRSKSGAITIREFAA